MQHRGHSYLARADLWGYGSHGLCPVGVGLGEWYGADLCPLQVLLRHSHPSLLLALAEYIFQEILNMDVATSKRSTLSVNLNLGLLGRVESGAWEESGLA